MASRIVLNPGDRFGRLTLVRPCHINGKLHWECLCDCGNSHNVRGYYLPTGHTRSCGCLHSETSSKAIRESKLTHGMTDTPTYKTWTGMRERCRNPKCRAFPRYGGRGITVCERWDLFENFLKDMGERPSSKTLDRYPDNDGNYEPGNCRWATRKQQSNNTSSNHLISFDGKTMNISQWAKETGMNHSVIRARIRMGWPIDRLLTEEVTKSRSRS